MEDKQKLTDEVREFLVNGGKPSIDQVQRAREAIQAARPFLPGLTALYRGLTGNERGRVMFSAQGSATDGEHMFLRPPMELADAGAREHVRSLCGKRDPISKRQRCDACHWLDEINVDFSHEIGHKVEGSFGRLDDSDFREGLRVAVESRNNSPLAQRAAEKWADNPPPTYMAAAHLVSPWLPSLFNALEDSRVNLAICHASPGLQPMFEVDVLDRIENGFMDEAGEMRYMADAPLLSQVFVAVHLLTSGFPSVVDYVSDEARDVLADEQLQELIVDFNQGVQVVGQVFRFALRFLERFREMGLCPNPNDPDEEPEPEPEQDEEPDEPEQDEESDELDESEPGDGEDDTEDETDPESDSDKVDDSSPESDNPDEPGQSDSEESPDQLEEESQAETSDDPGEGEPEGDDADESGGEADADTEDDGDGTGEADEDADCSGDEPSDEPGDGDGDEPSDEPGDGESADVPDPGHESDQDGTGSSEDDEELDQDADDQESGSGEQEADQDPETGDSGDPTGDPDDASGTTDPGDSQSDDTGQEAGDPGEPGDASDPGDGPSGPTMPGDGDGPGSPDPFLGMGSPEEAQEMLDQMSGHKGLNQDPDEDRPEAPPSIDPVEDQDDDDDDEPLAEDPDEEGEDLTHSAGCGDVGDEVAMELALRQSAVMEGSSAQIFEVIERRWGDFVPGNPGGWTNNYLHGHLPPTPETILAPALQALRRTFQENRQRKLQKNLKAGKVNARVLARRVPTQDPRLFGKTKIPGKRDWFVCIGMDCSGSTSWPLNGAGIASLNRIELEKQTVAAMADLLHRLGVDFAIYAHTATLPEVYEGRYGVYNSETGDVEQSMLNLDFCVVKEPNQRWDAEVRARLAAVRPAGGNLDGHSLEYYRKVCDRQQHTDKVIMYITDGDMPAANYEEELEVLQREIKRVQHLNTTIVGIGICNDAPRDHGLDTIVLEQLEDMPQVVRDLQKRLT